MKKNLNIILSLTALVGVVILVAVWSCQSMSLTAVSLDTFIGVMVTMIGILVTFAVSVGKLSMLWRLKVNWLKSKG
jgi:uncharacterized Tic20 family protein